MKNSIIRNIIKDISNESKILLIRGESKEKSTREVRERKLLEKREKVTKKHIFILIYNSK